MVLKVRLKRCILGKRARLFSFICDYDNDHFCQSEHLSGITIPPLFCSCLRKKITNALGALDDTIDTIYCIR